MCSGSLNTGLVSVPKGFVRVQDHLFSEVKYTHTHILYIDANVCCKVTAMFIMQRLLFKLYRSRHELYMYRYRIEYVYMYIAESLSLSLYICMIYYQLSSGSMNYIFGIVA